jgi:hypothetical protein
VRTFFARSSEEEETEDKAVQKPRHPSDALAGTLARGNPGPTLTEISLCFSQNQLLENSAPFLRLRKRIRHWEALNPGATLLKIIQNGITIPWARNPPPIKKKPLPGTREEMLRLAAHGAVRELSAAEAERTRTWSPVFVIPKKNGGTRLICDLRIVNRQNIIPRFKCDTLVTALEAATTASYGTVIDLQDFFWNLALNPEGGRWFRYWDGQQGWQATALPFGWNGSPYWTQRLARPIVKWLRQRGHQVVWYVDDLLILGPDYEEAVWSPQWANSRSWV